MSDCAVLIKEIEALPPSCWGEVLEFVEAVKQKNRAGEKTEKSAGETAWDMRDSLPTIEECIQEAEEKYAAWKDAGVDPLLKWRDSLGGKKIFDGVDGVAYQRGIRNEWDD